MITVDTKGSFQNIESFLSRASKNDATSILSQYGQVGADALENATPIDTGLTASSWYFVVEKKRGRYSITWHNRNTEDDIPIAILIQFGHGTGTGGYVQGRDFINPALQPIFDKIAADVWKEVTR